MKETEIAPGERTGSETISPARQAWVENIALLLRHKKLILSVTVVVVALTAVYAFVFMPNWYRASAAALPARKSGGLLDNISGGISSTIKDLGITKLGGGSGEGSYSPLALLNSRELRVKLVKQFDMMKVYESKTMSDAVDEFSDHVSGEISEEGDFSISFEDTDPKRAAAIANALVAGMNEINTRMAVEEAKLNFVFVEQRFKKNTSDLDSAERELGRFQQKYGVYVLPEQAKAELVAVAAAEAEKNSTELRLHAIEQTYGTQTPEAQILRNALGELTAKLEQMKSGQDAKASSYFVPMKVLPEVALLYLRLMREVEIQSKLKAFILPTYEQAKLDQTKVTLAFVTLDHAVAPQKKARPHRSIVLAISAIASFILTSIFIMLYANWIEVRKRFAEDRKRLAIPS
jgi:tyrosine-protein kinase Etk/Wzc